MTTLQSGPEFPDPVVTGPAARASLAALRERFVSDPAGTDLTAVRPVIARSWQRSVACNVSPGTNLFEHVAEPHLDEQLLRSAEPVLTDLERMCMDTNGCVSLTDPLGTLSVFRGEPSVVRWADQVFPTAGGRMSEDITGTNSDGTAIEEGTAVQVWGAEHFTEALQGICCTSVPVRDPLRRSVRGVLSLTLPEQIALESDPRSILLIVQGAAAEVTRLLADRMAEREQSLLSAYLQEVRKRGTDAVVAMDDRTTIASQGAMKLLDQSDYPILAGYAREAERSERAVEHRITTGDGRVLQLQARPVSPGKTSEGTVFRIRRASEPKTSVTVPTLPRNDPFAALVGSSVHLRRAVEAATTAVDRKMPAYILGEPGTGKRMLAGQIADQMSQRTLTLDAVSGGLSTADDMPRIESALDDGAAVVLQHIEAAPEGIKAEIADLLLRHDRPRVVMTTHKAGPEVLPVVTALRGIEIQMPPLRARREDIAQLASHFAGATRRISPRLSDSLTAADWPGNVTQLRELVAAAVAQTVATEVSLENLPENYRRQLARVPLTRLEEAELQQIREALSEADGNRLQAAASLQIGRSTLYRKIHAYERRGYFVETEAR